VSKSWLYELLDRYRAEGEAAFEPRSRRPHRSPTATAAAVVELVVGLRKQLSEADLDAGPATIAWHLQHHHRVTLSVATVARILTREGLITPAPKKRPKALCIPKTSSVSCNQRVFVDDAADPIASTDSEHVKINDSLG
jgi:transposase